MKWYSWDGLPSRNLMKESLENIHCRYKSMYLEESFSFLGMRWWRGVSSFLGLTIGIYAVGMTADFAIDYSMDISLLWTALEAESTSAVVVYTHAGNPTTATATRTTRNPLSDKFLSDKCSKGRSVR